MLLVRILCAAAELCRHNFSLIVAFVCLVVFPYGAWCSPCRSESAQQSCGGCIKAAPECAWCTEPAAAFGGEHRCDVNTTLADSCAADAITQPRLAVEFPQNRHVGEVKADGVTVTQLEPQQVKITMKPGETATFSMIYLHLADQLQDAYVLNSEAESQGLTIGYSVVCKGKTEQQNICQEVAPDERVEFIVAITLKECKTSGDAVVSIGVGGHRDVVAAYITPVCGCACERFDDQLQAAPECKGRGTLICGACVCDQGYTGDDCFCNVGKLMGGGGMGEEKCIREGDDKVCSGMGQCACGVCKCKNIMLTGEYCECDSGSCGRNEAGELCSGRGRCECGMCACELQWSGEMCDCDLGDDMCRDGAGTLCSGRGQCQCNRCRCSEGHEGDVCQSAVLLHKEIDESELRPTPTEAVRDTTTGEAEEEETAATPAPVVSAGITRCDPPLAPLAALCLLAKLMRAL